jgi:excisionase family DNA binding protein
VLIIQKEVFSMSEPTKEKWSSLEDIAEHLGVSKDTIYRWISKKQMPATKIGRHWKFKLSEVEMWIRNGKSGDSDNGVLLTKVNR